MVGGRRDEWPIPATEATGELSTQRLRHLLQAGNTKTVTTDYIPFNRPYATGKESLHAAEVHATILRRAMARSPNALSCPPAKFMSTANAFGVRSAAPVFVEMLKTRPIPVYAILAIGRRHPFGLLRMRRRASRRDAKIKHGSDRDLGSFSFHDCWRTIPSLCRTRAQLIMHKIRGFGRRKCIEPKDRICFARLYRYFCALLAGVLRERCCWRNFVQARRGTSVTAS